MAFEREQDKKKAKEVNKRYKKIEHRKIAMIAREGNERWSRFILETKTYF
jgi:hypothetical protein